MGSEEVWEMRETAIHVDDVTPMLDKDTTRENTPAGTPNSHRRSNRVVIADPEKGEHEVRRNGLLGEPGGNPDHIDWNRRRSSAIEAEKLRIQEEELRRMSRWRAFNHNRYATRKTAAQGMMDMALMLANASQLKSVIQEGPTHQHYYLLLGLIWISIGLQIFTGIVLLVVGARESKCEDDHDEKNEKTNKLNNFSIALVFLITVTNIFITSFGINGNSASLKASGAVTVSPESGAFGTGSGSADIDMPTSNSNT